MNRFLGILVLLACIAAVFASVFAASWLSETFHLGEGARSWVVGVALFWPLVALVVWFAWVNRDYRASVVASLRKLVDRDYRGPATATLSETRSVIGAVVAGFFSALAAVLRWALAVGVALGALYLVVRFIRWAWETPLR